VNWEKYEEAVAMAVHQNLRINDKAKSLDELCTKIMLDAQTGQCDVAFIDYLGLINHDDRRKTLAQIIGDITKRLKNVAGECNIPVVLLAQLNRESAKENRSPQLTDLRDSGSIEQDADVVLMLERPRDEMGVVEDNKIDMWVRKNRGGKCNFDEAIHLIGNESYSQFYEIAEGERYQEGGSNFEQEEQF
jgi:replicative DNA helicase